MRGALVLCRDRLQSIWFRRVYLLMLIADNGGRAPFEDSGERVSPGFTPLGAASPPLAEQIVGPSGSFNHIFFVHVSAGVCA